jgi:hypothetical protein
LKMKSTFFWKLRSQKHNEKDNRCGFLNKFDRFQWSPLELIELS